MILPEGRKRGFEVISERTLSQHEADLVLAAGRLRQRYRINRPVDGIVKEIMATMNRLPNFIKPMPDHLETVLRQGVPEAADALRRHAGITTKREATARAKQYLSARRQYRGQPERYDPAEVMAFKATIERITGRPLTVSRTRDRRGASGTRSTGPPAGAMFDTLIAALSWAYATFLPDHGQLPVQREAIVSLVRRERQKANVQIKNPTTD